MRFSRGNVGCPRCKGKKLERADLPVLDATGRKMKTFEGFLCPSCAMGFAVRTTTKPDLIEEKAREIGAMFPV